MHHKHHTKLNELSFETHTITLRREATIFERRGAAQHTPRGCTAVAQPTTAFEHSNVKHLEGVSGTAQHSTAHPGHLRPRLVESGIADAVESVREAGYPGLIPVAQQPGAARIGEHKVEAGVPPSLLFPPGGSGSIRGMGQPREKRLYSTARANILRVLSALAARHVFFWPYTCEP